MLFSCKTNKHFKNNIFMYLNQFFICYCPCKNQTNTLKQYFYIFKPILYLFLYPNNLPIISLNKKKTQQGRRSKYH